MTESEAKKEVEHNVFRNTDNFEMAISKKCYKTIINALEEIQQYKALGTVEELRLAKEKQIPKKPEYEADGYAGGELVYDYAKCPICGHDFEYGINDWGCKYCSDCGQKLDWSDKE